MPTMVAAGILGLIAAVVTYAGVARYRLWAERHQILDLPNERSSHTYPTPRGGGLILVIVTLAFGWMLSAGAAGPAWRPAYLYYAAGASLIAAVSWLDDLRSLAKWTRLLVHILGAVIAISGLGYWHSIQLPLLGAVTLGWWGSLVTALWIVGLTNAYNFMDGIDAIAGGQALVGGLAWALLGWTGGHPLVGGIGWLLACSSVGFLIHNWHPARVFLGDVGSAFMGYTLAVLPLMYGFFDKESARAPLAGLLVVWPFVFDTSLTFMQRLWRGENVFMAHRKHLYQRMAFARAGHMRVALLYAGLAMAGCVLALLWSMHMAQASLVILIALPALCLGLFALAAKLGHQPPAGGPMQPGSKRIPCGNKTTAF
jgi:UDP-N-acetylmuramyl pentapeptide phosphotransferase/UDP-N-acetylglucosamine-1-phosphate transferase